MTILLAEQNAAMALARCNRACVLESGTISLKGDADALRESEAIKCLYLGGWLICAQARFQCTVTHGDRTIGAQS
jgi:ABC-type lipopolysaccharide export system ATPase subunit